MKIHKAATCVVTQSVYSSKNKEKVGEDQVVIVLFILRMTELIVYIFFHSKVKSLVIELENCFRAREIVTRSDCAKEVLAF